MELENGTEEEMPKLELLTPAAAAYLKQEQKDQFSFSDIIPHKYFEIIGEHISREIGIEDLKTYVGYDKTAPLSDETRCVVCISDMICDKAAENNPNDANLQFLLSKWKELEDASSEVGHQRKRLSEIARMKKEFYATLATWTESELLRLQKIFLDKLESLDSLILESTKLMPRYVTRIYMRESDEHRRGEIWEKNGQVIHSGSFVAVDVSPDKCFSRIVFTLGLQPGYHVLAGCGNSDNFNSHLYALRNIRMKYGNGIHRQGMHSFEKWSPLYAQTYDQANKIKELNDAEIKDSAVNNDEPRQRREKLTLQDLWFSRNNSKTKIMEPELWVTGEELEKALGQPDSEFRHTVRGIAVRKGIISQEWEILTVVERGDNAAEKTGKPPAWGLPGGMRENGITLRDTLCRETQNEAQTRAVTKIVALVAEQEKQKRKDCAQKNIDHWFVIETDREAGLSKKMIEGDEIYSVQWIPFSELSTFGFQHTRQGSPTVWDVKKVHERKLIYPNHAAKLIEILPRLNKYISEIVIPENFQQFKDNLQKFKSENSY